MCGKKWGEFPLDQQPMILTHECIGWKEAKVGPTKKIIHQD